MGKRNRQKVTRRKRNRCALRSRSSPRLPQARVVLDRAESLVAERQLVCGTGTPRRIRS